MRLVVKQGDAWLIAMKVVSDWGFSVATTFIERHSMKKTGWPPDLLQDDCRKLHKWFASRIDARWVVRQVCIGIERKRNGMDACTSSS
jgi:hypothetical protein